MFHERSLIILFNFLMRTFRHTILAPLIVTIFLMHVKTLEENQQIEITRNITEFQLECMINNKTYTGNECLEGLNKFGRIVSWIVIGFLMIIFFCCCGCWCCICKIIHGKKNRGNGGQVLSGPHNPVITTVA